MWLYRWLNLHYCKAISDKGLMQLAALTGLVHLDIGFCGKLTDRYMLMLVLHWQWQPCIYFQLPNPQAVYTDDTWSKICEACANKANRCKCILCLFILAL